jgi:hypothetical protein
MPRCHLSLDPVMISTLSLAFLRLPFSTIAVAPSSSPLPTSFPFPLVSSWQPGESSYSGKSAIPKKERARWRGDVGGCGPKMAEVGKGTVREGPAPEVEGGRIDDKGTCRRAVVTLPVMLVGCSWNQGHHLNFLYTVIQRGAPHMVPALKVLQASSHSFHLLHLSCLVSETAVEALTAQL